MSQPPHDGRIAVVGGGPAGAMAASLLASTGHEVIVVDEKLAWEKPCGGGLTYKALAQYPFLAQAHVERNWIEGCELISPSGCCAWFALDKPVAIFSRRVLNELLLKRAENAGAQIVCDRVVAIDGAPGECRIRTLKSALAASYVILAAGARSSFRAQLCSPFSPADLMATVGYYIPLTGSSIQIKFARGLEGYIWIFPRHDHVSAGICGKLGGKSTAELRQMLDEFLREQSIDLHDAQLFSHILPAPRAETFRQLRLQGDGWAMIGDTAGLVDPITGEGLYYALRSAELLAQAIIAGQPHTYTASARQDFLPELETAALYADRFYSGRFLGGAVLDRVVQFTARSARVRRLMCDVFGGAQGYVGLRRRAYLTFLSAIPELALNQAIPSPSKLWRNPA
jgi:geranylgeranyl reductase family protein